MNNNKSKPLKYSEIFQVALLSIALTGLGVGALKLTTSLRDSRIKDNISLAQASFDQLHYALQKHYDSHNSFPKPPADHLLTLDFLTRNQMNIQTSADSDEPIALKDPFNNNHYNYYSNESSWCILISSGPDRDYDLEESFLEKITNPTIEELAPRLWDPSNGFRSGGDLFQIGPVSISDATT